MKKAFVVSTVICLFISSVASADTFGTGANQFEIDFVTISNATNPTSGYGIVNNDYRMGTYEITNDQFAKFAANTPSFTGADVPANKVSWYEAAQFVNYLNTSTGNQAAYNFTDSTFAIWDVTDAGYDAGNPFRNSNAKYFLPTENEWVKAAYWNGTNLQTWATVGDVAPTQAGWNFYDNGFATDPYGPWDVGDGTQELNGTFDMMGNVWEWMESPYFSGDYISGSYRGIRGGAYHSDDYYLRSSTRDNYNPSYEYKSLGFRVASIPEPATVSLLAFGGLALLRRRK